MEYLIKLTEEEFSVIESSLGELPYKLVAPIMDKLHRCWDIICHIKKAMSNAVDGHSNGYTNGSVSSMG